MFHTVFVTFNFIGFLKLVNTFFQIFSRNNMILLPFYKLFSMVKSFSKLILCKCIILLCS